MALNLPPKKTEAIKAKPQPEKIIETKKPTGPKLQLRNTEEIARQNETDIEFSVDNDLEFPKEFYEIEGFNAKLFEENIFQLAEELTVENPKIRSYLKDIMKNLHTYPELNHLLSDKQIGIFVEGMKRQKGIEISAKKPAQTSATKAIGNLSSEEILNLEF